MYKIVLTLLAGLLMSGCQKNVTFFKDKVFHQSKKTNVEYKNLLDKPKEDAINSHYITFNKTGTGVEDIKNLSEQISFVKDNIKNHKHILLISSSSDSDRLAFDRIVATRQLLQLSEIDMNSVQSLIYSKDSFAKNSVQIKYSNRNIYS